MAAWAASAHGVHIRAAGTTEIPVQSGVSSPQAAQMWKASGTPPAGVHKLSKPSRRRLPSRLSQLIEVEPEPGVQSRTHTHLSSMADGVNRRVSSRSGGLGRPAHRDVWWALPKPAKLGSRVVEFV